MAGHTISNQICCVGAQVKHIQTYGNNNKSTFDENAVQYKSMNKTRVISKVMTEDTTITNMEELWMQQRIDRVFTMIMIRMNDWKAVTGDRYSHVRKQPK